jgi:putative tryptophan/tyrosine transport system substrate-binding protein
MNRRGVLSMLGGSLLLGGPLAAKAQSAKGIHRVGVLGLGPPTSLDDIQRGWAPARALGWIEGQNLIVERRYADGNEKLLRSYAEELVRLNVEVILTNGTSAAIAAKNATTRIPIIMISSGDPVRAGLVASLARPAGNITGFSIVSTELDAKRLALLHEALPTAQRVGVLVNPANSTFEIARIENERVYRQLGLQPIVVNAAAVNELESAVAEAARRGAQALYVALDRMFSRNGPLIIQAALRHALPTVVSDNDLVRDGALLSVSIDEEQVFHTLAYFLDKILRGAKPADLPVQQPTKFVLSLNLKTAKALRITIPQSLIARADEVIK